MQVAAMLSEPATLTRLRTRYQEDSALVRQTFERTGDGSAAIRRRAQIVGRLICELWDDIAAGAGERDIAIIATGGFGRRELFPCSDVDRKSTRLNSSHPSISYAVFCLKKKKTRKAASVA